MNPIDQLHIGDFLSALRWIDGRPLQIEPYRMRLFEQMLVPDEDGRLKYSVLLAGRGKKNAKTQDGCLASIYRFLVWELPEGQSNDCLICAGDADQARNVLDLCKKIIAANPVLAEAVEIYNAKIVRHDGNGTLSILFSGGGAAPSIHGVTFDFIFYDEIWQFRDYKVIERLAVDPTRQTTVWLTSYAGSAAQKGIPICDLYEMGRTGSNHKMLFSWYAGDFTTDPDFMNPEVTPEQRANPSMATWSVPGYLAQQKSILPSAVYARLHLNLPGPQPGQAYSADAVDACIAKGVKICGRHPTARHVAFCDMSGGSSDDAVLAVAHWCPDTDRPVLDMICAQPGGAVPFNPRFAVAHFCTLLGEYAISHVTGDRFAGDTFTADWAAGGRIFQLCTIPAYELYSKLEVMLNGHQCALLDVPKLREQLLGLRVSGTTGRIAHQSHAHDDFANAAAGALFLARPTEAGPESRVVVGPVLVPGANVGQRYEAVGGKFTGYSPTGFRWDATDR